MPGILRKRTLWILLLIGIIALALRFWRLEAVPPGWRDDELINSLVISQKVLDGDLSVYYPDASGHEALYHVLSAGTLALFGPGTAGIRWLPALLGTVTVLLTYLLANRLFGRTVALGAAMALAVSFWSLMYSRIGIRHISLPVFMLASFYAFWRGLESYGMPGNDGAPSKEIPAHNSPVWFALSGLFLGLGFYTYFASRGIPIILLLFIIYLASFQRPLLRRTWRGLVVMFGLAILLAIPLVITLTQQPESEARVEELAVPLVEAREGNLNPLLEHVTRTLNMFHSDGDDEWLYNIPYRPVFSPLVAVLFWLGIVTAMWYAVKPLWRLLFKNSVSGQVSSSLKTQTSLEMSSAFVLIWWLVGVSPGFFSVPAASLGHTIIAQSAVYIILVLPLLPLSVFIRRRRPGWRRAGQALTIMFACLLIATIALRDLPDYFVEWPSRGMTRFLYRADINELAEFLNENKQIRDFAVSGLLAGPWDRLAMAIDLEDDDEVFPRWFDSQRAIFLQTGGEPALVFYGYPADPAFYEELYKPALAEPDGDYRMAQIDNYAVPASDPTCFTNGLCLLSATYLASEGSLDLMWQVGRSLDLPTMPLMSNPPPPGVYAGPRLSVFAQIVDSDDAYLSGDDGLWVDVESLQPGDLFIQRHRLSAPPGTDASAIIFGLYDPKTGERYLAGERDFIRLDLTG